ncbi:MULTISPECIES: hypothetical protein [unclassified Phenylobacterium]|uniref:hypothetical protein n=1 Tax=unclassified Phenylobacterium TaxID=2640670 RepID=UPI000AB1ACE2|nr:MULTISPECIES: hypothetical protein [unclassified Phenylobacterium]
MTEAQAIDWRLAPLWLTRSPLSGRATGNGESNLAEPALFHDPPDSIFDKAARHIARSASKEF